MTQPLAETGAPASLPEAADRRPDRAPRWQMRGLTDRHVLLLTWLVYLAAVLLWCTVASLTKDASLGDPATWRFGFFPRKILIYPDELLYWRLARGIGTGAGLSVYETPARFAKIGYSLLLAPFFRIGDPLLRVQLAGYLNAALMCSAVFPMRRIARRITGSRPIQLACVLVTAVSPFYALTLTFMTENLFMPLVLWLVLAYFRLLDRVRDAARERFPAGRLAAASALTGVFAFLTMLVKDVGIALAVSFCGLLLWRMIRAGRGKRKLFLLALLAHVAALLVCLALKSFLLSPVNSYAHQTSLENLNTLYRFEYFLYAIVRIAPFYLLALMILPALYPLAVARHCLDAANRERLRFLLVALGLILAAVSFSISVREDLGKWIPRIHTRYLVGMLPVFTALTLEAMRHPADPAQRRRFRWIVVCVALMLAFLGTLSGGTRVDHPDLRFYETVSALYPVEEPSKEITVIPQGRLLLALIWLLGAGLIGLCLRLNRRRTAACLLLLAIGAVSLFSGFSAADNYRQGFSTSERKAEDTAAMDAWLQANAGEEGVLYIREKWLENTGTILDTYLTAPYWSVNYADLKAALDEGGRIDLAGTRLKSGLTRFRSEESYPAGTGFRYVVFDAGKVTLDPACGEEAARFPDIGLTVWRLYDPMILQVEKLSDIYQREP